MRLLEIPEVALSGSGRWPSAQLLWIVIASLALTISCTKKQKVLTVVPRSSPVSGTATEPNLSLASDGRVLLSWVEPATGGGKALRFAALSGSSWGSANTAYAGSKPEDSPGELPLVVATPDHKLYAAWTQVSMSTQADYREDIFTSSSADGGQNWSAPRPVNLDHTISEHGYLSLAPTPDGTPTLLWLDGRDYAGKHRYHLLSTALNTATFSEAQLDDDVCTCCPTAIVGTPRGLVAAYRDHEPGEIRDISVVRAVDGKWLDPKPVSHDRWHINGCPTNGPSLAAQGAKVVLAWFTAAQDQPAVKVSFSSDEGASWSKPVVVSDTPPVGRATVATLPDGSAAVLWVASGQGASQLVGRRVSTAGELGPILTLSDGGVRGRPRAITVGERIVVSWSEGESTSRVRIAELSLR